MTAKLTKDVTHRMRSALFVLSAFWKQGPGIAQQVRAVFEPHLEPVDHAPDPHAQIVAYARTLRAALDRLLLAERKLYDAGAHRSDLRHQRNDQFRRLHRMILALRQGVLAAYVAPELSALGLQGPNGRDPLTLVRQAELIVQLLARDDVSRALGEPLFQQPYDPRPYAAELAAATTELRATLDQLRDLQRHIDTLLVEKHAAMKANDHIFLRTARGFEELCRLAGEDELAAKVRPSKSRGGRTHAPPPEESGEDGNEQPAASAEPPSSSLAEARNLPSRFFELANVPTAAVGSDSVGLRVNPSLSNEIRDHWTPTLELLDATPQSHQMAAGPVESSAGLADPIDAPVRPRRSAAF